MKETMKTFIKIIPFIIAGCAPGSHRSDLDVYFFKCYSSGVVISSGEIVGPVLVKGGIEERRPTSNFSISPKLVGTGDCVIGDKVK